MKLKMLDYKFLLIIIISMIVYFLYRRIECIEGKVKNIENKFNPDKNKPIELSLPNENDNELPLPKPEELNTNIQENFDTIDFPFNSNIVNGININKLEENINIVEQVGEPNVVEKVEPNIVEQVEPNVVDQINNEDDDDNVNKNLDKDTLEEYSNEQSEVQIYSNDNEEDNHNSIIESMVDAVDKNDKDDLNDLLKNNKLPELQQLAEDLSITIHKDNNKKKTKLELATDILNNKK